MVEVSLTPKLELSVWASPMPGDSLTDLYRKLLEVGNQSIQIDEENNRILVAQVKD